MTDTRLAVTLLDNASATGDWKVWPGGDGRIDVCGTIGGATLTLQVKGCDGTTAHTVGTDTTFTATGSNGFKLEAGSQIRMAVASGSPSALYVSAYRI
jgi:hypothetical protein